MPGLDGKALGLKATNDNAALLQWSFPQAQDRVGERGMRNQIIGPS
jgi:hypothetical protein